MKLNKPRLVFASLLVIVLVSCGTQGLLHYRNFDQRRQMVRGRFRLQQEFKLCALILQHDGRLISSPLVLERSAYYPFMPNTCSRATGTMITFSEHVHGTLIVYSGNIEHASQHWMIVDAIRSGSARDRTARMMRNYLSGEKAQVEFVAELRNDYLELGKGTEIRECEEESCRKSLPIPNIKPVLPTTRQELKLYLSYIKGLEGTDELDDAWGRPLLFTLGNGLMECRSAGPDGRYNTADDLVFAQRLRTAADVSKRLRSSSRP